MSIQFSGLGSGLDINTWIEKLITAKKTETVQPLEKKLTTLQNQSSALDTIKSSFAGLQNSLKTFTDVIAGTSNDIWSKTNVKSSNDAYVTATSTNGLAEGTTSISVEKLATATVAKSSNAAKLIDSDTKYSLVGNNQAKGGTFSIYVDNKRYEIDINKDEDTLGSIAQKINDATGGKAEAKVNSDGTFEISSTDGAKVSIGAVSDTSNFANIMKLTKNTGNGVKSAYAQTSFRTNVALASENNGLKEAVTTGKIKINGVEFEIDENTALKDLINKINSSQEAKVSAQYDTLTNQLIFTSKETGEFNISLEQEGTNFFDVFGLTQDGALVEGTQTLGSNAELTINGNKIVSSSNTVTGETSGISGLTLTLKKVTDGTDKDNTTGVTIDATRDTSAVKSAIKDFITAYNTVTKQIKEATAKDGYLEMDSSLRNIQQEMRSIISSFTPDNGAYGLLSQIGISTGKAGLDVSNTATELVFDEEAFDKAYAADSDAVKNLISGGFDGGGKGVFDKLASKAEKLLDPTYGTFTTKADSISKMISSQEDRISRAYERLESYETRITKQFQYMDEMIAKLQQQYSSFLS